jgi:Ca-activated chloride channel family protein
MQIGERRIRGIIRERKEAEEIYRAAKDQGHPASLLVEERPNIFRQSVANIEPGKRIDVNITYYETLPYVDGWYEFVFPMVVGPRYNPPGMTAGIGVVPRNLDGASGQDTEVQYLKPTERSGHDISLRVDVNAGVAIEEFVCPSHRIVQEPADTGCLSVALAADDKISNKDFVLRYRVAGERIKSDVIAQRSDGGGYFTLMLFPPRELNQLARAPLEMVFLLDCSGNMAGQPIEQAKTAIRHALHQLRPEDSFQIINFSERAPRLGDTPLEATPANVRRGVEYVASLNGDGPTAMIEGINAALDFPRDLRRTRFVCFLTDGFIGNESEILKAVHEKLGPSRIFSFGVGSSPNRYLLDNLAKMGQGAVAYLGLHDDAGEVMDQFMARISHPGMTDLKIDWGGVQVSEVYPARLPDLFVGRPVILTGKCSGTDATQVRVKGNAGGREIEEVVPVHWSEASAGNRALPNVWARAKIASLAERMAYDSNEELPLAIKRVALDYGLVSPFTAFIAVDAAGVTAGGEAATAPVGVPTPDGVKYDTTVQQNRKEEPK